MDNKYTSRTFALEIVAVVIALLFMVPFYFVLINAVKSNANILLDAASFPKDVIWDNFQRVWKLLHFPRAFMNSLLVTVLANVGLIVISSMAGWMLARTPGKVSRVLFVLFVAAMVIPFQTIMIPLVKLSASLNLVNSIPGLVFIYFGFGVSMTMFLFHGFIKSVPREVEESAGVDGCSPFGVFWRIVFPLLKPIVVTVVILNTLWIWNDYLLPRLMLQDADLHTIPVAMSALFAQYNKQWDLGLAGLVIGTLPIVVFSLLLQKHIVKGIAAGSGK
ncbi:carbohydrate ABC transporter permease [Cohnella sp. JJ-181]|uniref:carbohydrate ABC transporter permease n=1 Tax=Cohnella rhizoplanae TaxID=2974897 RepID=UPI0022FF6904|nr:carbohydrate ABC transporter permease [Cohnella sp. JJ-181]CAI6075615.1 Melibiose/raffinose/stachyose import permease protein MelC [Cohnella sp. JJ-181]